MSDLKDIYSHEKLVDIAHHFKKEAPDFSVEGFLHLVEREAWKEKTLRQRHQHLARVAFDCLDRPYPAVAEILKQMNSHAHGFSYLFLADMVSLYGLKEPKISMETLGVLTTGSSAEFAIRPFLEQDFEGTFVQMQIWATSLNEHHRRLASEGLRPKLPWGKKIASILSHQPAIFELLESLKADSSLYVRKSVANHLNDWSKTHPDQVLDLLENWQGGLAVTDWIRKRAARTLLKASHPRALALFGYQKELPLTYFDLFLSVKQVSKGDRLTVTYALEMDKKETKTKVRLELRVGFVKKTGVISYKTFMLKDTTLSSREHLRGKWTYDWVDKTTRRHYNGQHTVDVVVNGQVLAKEGLEVSGF